MKHHPRREDYMQLHALMGKADHSPNQLAMAKMCVVDGHSV